MLKLKGTMHKRRAGQPPQGGNQVLLFLVVECFIEAKLGFQKIDLN